MASTKTFQQYLLEKKSGIQRDYCSKVGALRLARRRLPFLKWLPTITLNTFLYDLAGGLTVGLTAIPQSLAYAQLASMPLETGLYTTIVSGLTYCVLGTAKDVNLGPTSLISLLTGSIIDGTGLYVHQLLCFFTGILLIAFACIRLEILLNIFPVTVTAGFTSAAAILIVCSQIKYFFGIAGLPRPFIELVPQFFSKIETTNLWDLVGGVLVLFFMLFVQYTVPILTRKVNKYGPNCCTKTVTAALLVFTTLRAIIAIVISAGIGFYLSKQYAAMATAQAEISLCNGTFSGNASMLFRNCTQQSKPAAIKIPLSLTGPVPKGLPRPGVPPFGGFDINDKTAQKPANWLGKNATANATKHLDFSTLISDVGIGLAIIPLIAVIELLAIGRALAQRNGYVVDASQEMFACGLAHLIGSFLNAYPSSASVTRSALNSQCEVKTQLCSFFTAALVLIAAATIADTTLPYVPKSCLAAVVIAAALNMVETHLTKTIWKVNRIDTVPLAVTFVACMLLDIEYGVLVGVVFTLVFSTILSMCSIRKHIAIREAKLASNSNMNHLYIQMPEGELRYHCAEAIKKLWQKTSGHVGPIIIDCSTVREADFATVIAILYLAKNPAERFCHSVKYPVVLVGLHHDQLKKFTNTVSYLKIKQPGHRDIYFASDIFSAVMLIEGVCRRESNSDSSSSCNEDIEMAIHPSKSTIALVAINSRRKSH